MAVWRAAAMVAMKDRSKASMKAAERAAARVALWALLRAVGKAG